MIQLWCDVETTGIDPINSSAFEIAFLIYEDGLLQEEKLYHLNPLNEVIKFSEEAFNTNGVPEETIRTYPVAEEVMPEIANWLTPWVFTRMDGSTEPSGKFVFAGYCANFDYGHLKALFDRCDIPMNEFFDGRIIDVHELVKRAQTKRLIGDLPDRKLTTVTKELGIPHETAHTALSDIRATRKLYEAIYAMERKAK